MNSLIAGIFHYFSNIPDVIWSGLIASFLTLSGVFLSNRSNSNRLRDQLKHDSEEKDKERKNALRREIYLVAAEEMVKANVHLSTLPMLDIAKTNPADGIQGLFRISAKLQLVGETKTVFLLNDLQTAFTTVVFKLMAKVQPMQELRSDITIRSDHLANVQADISRILAAMTQYNEAINKDRAVFDALQVSFDQSLAVSKKAARERNKFQTKFNKLHKAYAQELMEEMQIIGEKQIPLFVELRKELGLSGDIEDFEANLNAHRETLANQLNEFVEKVS